MKRGKQTVYQFMYKWFTSLSRHDSRMEGILEHGPMASQPKKNPENIQSFSHVILFLHSQFHPLPANSPPQLTSLAACILSTRGMAPLRRGAGLRAEPLPGGANRSALPRWAPRSGEPSLSCSGGVETSSHGMAGEGWRNPSSCVEKRGV